jgi:tetratricopeptide (TPR) repeat protein
VTLNITVATRRCIYQSADFRLLDLTTGETSDFETQKIVLVNTFAWTATVCFAGVGRTRNVDVAEWLADLVASIDWKDPFERLLDGLHDADSWLSTVPDAQRRHSFSVGAFVGSAPVVALVSNYESLVGPRSSAPAARLSSSQIRPTRPTTVVSGQWSLVSRPERRRLERLAAGDPEPSRMYTALVDLNEAVAGRTRFVSPACFTTHLRLTGEGGAQAHGLGDRPFMPTFMVPAAVREAVSRLLDEQFGPGRARLESMTVGRVDNTDDYHRVQLREKPNDPNAHCNYGVYLLERKGDQQGAEREYRLALRLDPYHVNALGNLANLLWHEPEEAAALYQQALRTDPGSENATFNYARLLLSGEPPDRIAARSAIDEALSAYSDSGRLYLLRAELCLRELRADDALRDFERAEELNADHARVASGYATALQMSGEGIGKCIAAYHAAVALNPANAALKLNLAQLLFVVGDDDQGRRQLGEAIGLGLHDSAQLEAQFYLLAHTAADAAVVFEAQHASRAAGPQGVRVVDAVTAGEGRHDERQELVADVRPARLVAEVEMLVDEALEVEVLGQRRRQEEPRVRHQAIVVEGRVKAIQAVR